MPEKDSGCQGDTLFGGRTFIAGPIFPEFDKCRRRGFQGAQDAFDNAQKPIVAAIHGTALGAASSR